MVIGEAVCINRKGINAAAVSKVLYSRSFFLALRAPRACLYRTVVWGKLGQFAALFTKGAHIEVEGQLRHRAYQKQIQSGKKTASVDMTVAEIHATTVRKLDRTGSSANSDGEELSEEAPE